MAKNILIISSNFTGHGHKSITEALCEKFNKYEDIKIHVVDGFSLGGKTLLKVGKSYGTITRNAKGLWKLIWNVSAIKPSLVDEIIEITIKDNFMELINKIKPDLILSVHPNFNGSIINILEKHKLKIPFITLIADLVSIYPLWADPRADYIISPSEEAKNKCIEFGVPDEKIKVLGFPVRSRFYKHIKEKSEPNSFNSKKPFKCLLMSGGEGVGNMRNIARILLKNFNCEVSIIAGRNKALRRSLKDSFAEAYEDNIKIYGFVENVQDLMIESDILITRGSPNVMMEAVACNVPLVITGVLPGQEEGNIDFTKKHNLGVICDDIKNLHNIVADLIINDSQKLNQIKTLQLEYRDHNVAENIADFIASLL
jgi:processive 1,2-diacylglycerol beta-glucosyltransferase